MRAGDVWISRDLGRGVVEPARGERDMGRFVLRWARTLVSSATFSTEDELRDLWPGEWAAAAPVAPAPAPAFSAPVAHVLRFFRYEHLPASLQDVARPFADLADQVARSSSNPETTVALRKLLEAKDAAVRAVLP